MRVWRATICALYSLRITGGPFGGGKTAAIDFVCWPGVSPVLNTVDTYVQRTRSTRGVGRSDGEGGVKGVCAMLCLDTSSRRI